MCYWNKCVCGCGCVCSFFWLNFICFIKPERMQLKGIFWHLILSMYSCWFLVSNTFKDHVPCGPSREWQKKNPNFKRVCIYVFFNICTSMKTHFYQKLNTRFKTYYYTLCRSTLFTSNSHSFLASPTFIKLLKYERIFLLWLVTVLY